MKLSKLTIGYGLYIIISASFITKVWTFLEKLVGLNNKEILRIATLVIFSVLIFIYILKLRRGFLKLFANFLVFSLALIFSWWQPYFPEKLHVFEYGLLGWLATRDLNKDKISINGILLAVLFASLIGALDEGFQRLLPYRVGEIRDAITNVISGSFGVVTYLLK